MPNNNQNQYHIVPTLTGAVLVQNPEDILYGRAPARPTVAVQVIAPLPAARRQTEINQLRLDSIERREAAVHAERVQLRADLARQQAAHAVELNRLRIATADLEVRQAECEARAAELTIRRNNIVRDNARDELAELGELLRRARE